MVTETVAFVQTKLIRSCLEIWTCYPTNCATPPSYEIWKVWTKLEHHFIHSQCLYFTLLVVIILYFFHEIQYFAESYCICPLYLIVESLYRVQIRGQWRRWIEKITSCCKTAPKLTYPWQRWILEGSQQCAGERAVRSQLQHLGERYSMNYL